MSRDQEISSRLAKLSTTERHAVMTEAAVQFGSMDIDGNVLDYIENGLDMLASGEYVERDRVLRHRTDPTAAEILAHWWDLGIMTDEA